MLDRRRTPPSAAIDAEAPAVTSGPALAALVRLAENYGASDPTALIDPETLGRPAAARRALLMRLRSDPRLTPPPLGPADRLLPPRGPNDPPHPLDVLDEQELRLLAGALLDGLDATALAHAMASHQKAIKGMARRLLAKLDGNAAGEQSLDSVATLMAGEYALGLLSPSAQALFERGLALDSDLQARVNAWDARFAALVGQPRRAARVLAAAEPDTADRAAGARGRRTLAAIGGILALVAVALAWQVVGGRLTGPGGDALPEARIAPAVEPVVVAAHDATAAPPLAADGGASDPPSGAGTARVPESDPPLVGSAQVAAAVDPGATRVTLYRAGGSTAAAQGDAIAAGLGEIGVPVDLQTWRGDPIARTRVRYFHDTDAAAAEQVRAALQGLGATAVVQDFTHYRPQPAPGTLEIWLAASGS